MCDLVLQDLGMAGQQAAAGAVAVAAAHRQKDQAAQQRDEAVQNARVLHGGQRKVDMHDSMGGDEMDR